jgi:hypothetical protein
MSEALKKFNRRVKAIRHQTGKSYKAAQQQASREHKGKVSGTHKSAHKKTRRRKVAGKGAYKCVHDVVKVSGTRRRRVGAVHRARIVGSVPQLKAAARLQVKEKLAWMLLARDSAKRVTDRRKLAKKVSELKKELKALS